MQPLIDRVSEFLRTNDLAKDLPNSFFDSFLNAEDIGDTVDLDIYEHPSTNHTFRTYRTGSARISTYFIVV